MKWFVISSKGDKNVCLVLSNIYRPYCLNYHKHRTLVCSSSVICHDFSLSDFEDEEEEKKKSMVTSRQTTIEIPIPSKAVGAVIGRQGQTIKEVRVFCHKH